MKSVKIYTYASLRPDLIPLQYASMRTFVEDSFEFIVFNNAIDSKKRRRLIDEVCKKIGVKCIHIQAKESLRTADNVEYYTFSRNKMRYTPPSGAFTYALKWSWKYLCEEKIIISVIDSDMFFCSNFNFNKLANKYHFSFVPQYRGLHENGTSSDVFYPWTGFFVIDISRIISPEEIAWDLGKINGYGVDPGGMAHHYLIKYNESLDLKFFNFYTINTVEKTDNEYKMHCCLNGCSNFYVYFSDSAMRVEITEPLGEDQERHVKFFPHEKPYNQYVIRLAEKCINYFKLYLLDSQTYPQPSCIDFVDMYDETYSPQNTCFIVHYKAASNYTGFSHKYHTLKTAYFYDLLNKSSNGKININRIDVLKGNINYANTQSIKSFIRKAIEWSKRLLMALFRKNKGV